MERPGQSSSSSAPLGLRQEAIRDLMQNRWAEHGLSFQGGAPHRVIASQPARIQEHSVLFEYAVTFLHAQPPLSVIAKIRREPRSTDDGDARPTGNAIRGGQAEWHELTNAYRYFAGRPEGLGVVRPVGYIEPYHALLVEKASGRELSKIIGTGASYLTPALMRAGRWLLGFHGLYGLPSREWTSRWYTTCLEERRTKFISLGASRGQWEPLIDRVQGYAERLSPQSVRRSVLHGDFRLRHIFATPDGIEVLDLGNAHEGDRYYDAASLVVELMTVQLGRPLIWRRRIDGYIRAFLDAYFGGDPPKIFWFYLIDRLFKKWGRWLSRWNHPAEQSWWSVASLQQCLQLVHATSVVNDLYVSPWFTARIIESLKRAVP